MGLWSMNWIQVARQRSFLPLLHPLLGSCSILSLLIPTRSVVISYYDGLQHPTNSSQPGDSHPQPSLLLEVPTGHAIWVLYLAMIPDGETTVIGAGVFSTQNRLFICNWKPGQPGLGRAFQTMVLSAWGGFGCNLVGQTYVVNFASNRHEYWSHRRLTDLHHRRTNIMILQSIFIFLSLRWPLIQISDPPNWLVNYPPYGTVSLEWQSKSLLFFAGVI